VLAVNSSVIEVALGGFGLEVVLDEVLGGEVAGRAVEALGRDGEECWVRV
jgi:hypothetical protein